MEQHANRFVVLRKKHQDELQSTVNSCSSIYLLESGIQLLMKEKRVKFQV